jgi:hypothetical protein
MAWLHDERGEKRRGEEMKRRREGRGRREEEETSRRGAVDERMRNEEWSTEEREGTNCVANYPSQATSGQIIERRSPKFDGR